MKSLAGGIILLFSFNCAYTQGSIGIGTSFPHTSALLELNSSNKGLLLPRINDTASIANPAKGLTIYNNADNKIWLYNGTRWQQSLTQDGGGDNTWYKGQDSITFSKNKYVGINTNPGFMAPMANLQVSNSLMVQESFVYSTSMPTVVQTYTMDNTSNLIPIPSDDSIFRIFDPGYTGNYNNNTQGNITAGSTSGQIGFKLHFSETDLGLAPGDTLWISKVGFPECRQNNIILFTGNRLAGIRDLIINDPIIYFIFRSDNAGTEKGFDITATRLFKSASRINSLSTAGSAMYFANGSLAAGYNATVTGDRSFAIGFNVKANGGKDGAGAIGFNAIANGASSIAIGLDATADGNNSLALGGGRTAGTNSMAFGNGAFSGGAGSVALGTSIKTSGSLSFAAGLGSVAKSYGSAVLGMLNDTSDTPNPAIIDIQDRLFQIGNGNGSTRSNALTILRNGNIGIGTVNPHTTLQFANTISNRKIVLWENANTEFDIYGFGVNGGTLRYNVPPASNHTFFAGNIPLFVLYGSGNATLLGTLSQLSDARLKKDISPLTNNLSRLLQLNGYTYYWKDENKSNQQQVGLLAQEVQQLYPQLVHTEKDGTLSVNYSGLTPVLIEAAKELNKKTETLQQRMEQQQQQIEELMKLLKK
jgi:hypothetical protein